MNTKINNPKSIKLPKIKRPKSKFKSVDTKSIGSLYDKLGYKGD